MCLLVDEDEVARVVDVSHHAYIYSVCMRVLPLIFQPLLVVAMRTEYLTPRVDKRMKLLIFFLLLLLSVKDHVDD